MPTQEFVPYATAPGANVQAQATYAAAATTATGQVSGIASSEIFNKIWRQACFVACCVSNMIYNTLAVDVLDNGDTTEYTAKLTAAIKALAAPPIGEVSFYAKNSAPTGYLECNGASLSTTTYAALFAVIGYTFGGAGASFSLPDLRGQFVRGWSHGLSPDAGRAFGSAQTDEFKSHTHTVAFYSDNSGNIGPGHGGSTASINSPITSSGTGGAGETRPLNIALLAIIRYT